MTDPPAAFSGAHHRFQATARFASRFRPGPAHLVALAAYFILTVLMTWPVASYLTSAIPGDGFDGWQNYWNLWWVKQALLIRAANPFFTDYLYAPTGVSLLFHTLNIFNGLWTLPLQLNFGLAVAYNSVVFFSFVFAGYGGYLLSLYTLTWLDVPLRAGLRPAAFIGGLVFTMAPFHMAHLLGHMQVFSLMWPPFYALWLLRTLEPWSALGSGRRWRNALISGLFLVLASLVDWYHTLYLLLFTALVLGWTLAQRWRRLSTSTATGPGAPRRPLLLFQAPRRTLMQPVWLVAVIGLVFVVLLSPLLLPMIREASSRPDLQTGFTENVALSADLLAFVTPSELHPLWREWAKTFADRFSSTTSERLIFAGFVPLALALLAGIRYWPHRVILFWSLVTLLFFILALGPYLHVGGQIVTVNGWQVPLPYLLLYHTVPFIGLTRSLSRYDLMIMMSLGVLAAMGAYRLTQGKGRPSNTGRNSRLWLPYLAAGLICFEFLAAPYPISHIDIPPFYQELGADTDDYTIAELPMNWDRPTPLLHQTVHQKRLLTAYTSRDNPLELAWRTPVFQHWRYLAPDIIDQPLDVIAPTIFFDFNLRYIVLDYWQMPPGPERTGTEHWLSAALPGAAPIYEDGRLKVYRSPPRGEAHPYLTLGSGWGGRQEDDSQQPVRTISGKGPNQAELFLHHPQNRPLRLKLTVAAPAGPRSLTILAGDQPAGQFQLTPAYSTFAASLPPFPNGPVRLQLRPDGFPGEVVVHRIALDVNRLDE